MSGVVFFGWGEIFSLFPSTLTDTFGAKDATTKYGFLYMAQGIGSVLGGPVAAALHDATASWLPVFITIIVMDALTAALAFFVLKPMRAAYLARHPPLIAAVLDGRRRQAAPLGYPLTPPIVRPELMWRRNT